MNDIITRLRDGPAPLADPNLNDEAADEIERLHAEFAICREAIEVAYDVVSHWPERLDDDGDMAVYRCTLRRLNEAVGKAVPRLLYERPEGQKLYGLHYLDLVEQQKADTALLRQALEALTSFDLNADDWQIRVVAALRERLGDHNKGAGDGSENTDCCRRGV